MAFVLAFRAEACLLRFKSDPFTTDLFGNYFAVGKIIRFGYPYSFEVSVSDNILD